MGRTGVLQYHATSPPYPKPQSSLHTQWAVAFEGVCVTSTKWHIYSTPCWIELYYFAAFNIKKSEMRQSTEHARNWQLPAIFYVTTRALHHSSTYSFETTFAGKFLLEQLQWLTRQLLAPNLWRAWLHRNAWRSTHTLCVDGVLGRNTTWLLVVKHQICLNKLTQIGVSK